MSPSIEQTELLIWSETDQLRAESFESTMRSQHKTIFEVENDLYLAQKRIDELVAQLEQCNSFESPQNKEQCENDIFGIQIYEEEEEEEEEDEEEEEEEEEDEEEEEVQSSKYRPKKRHIEELEPEPLSPLELKRNKLIADIRYYSALHYTKQNNYKPSNATIASGTIHMPQLKYPLSLHPLFQKYGLNDLDIRYEYEFGNNVNLEKGQVLTCVYDLKNMDTKGRILNYGYLLLPNHHDNKADYEIELLSYVLETYKNRYSCIASMIELSKLLDIEDLTTIQCGSTDRTILFECLKK